jgi:hypothetical protein
MRRPPVRGHSGQREGSCCRPGRPPPVCEPRRCGRASGRMPCAPSTVGGNRAPRRSSPPGTDRVTSGRGTVVPIGRITTSLPVALCGRDAWHAPWCGSDRSSNHISPIVRALRAAPGVPDHLVAVGRHGKLLIGGQHPRTSDTGARSDAHPSARPFLPPQGRGEEPAGTTLNPVPLVATAHAPRDR